MQWVICHAKLIITSVCRLSSKLGMITCLHNLPNYYATKDVDTEEVISFNKMDEQLVIPGFEKVMLTIEAEHAYMKWEVNLHEIWMELYPIDSLMHNSLKLFNYSSISYTRSFPLPLYLYVEDIWLPKDWFTLWKSAARLPCYIWDRALPKAQFYVEEAWVYYSRLPKRLPIALHYEDEFLHPR